MRYKVFLRQTLPFILCLAFAGEGFIAGKFFSDREPSNHFNALAILNRPTPLSPALGRALSTALPYLDETAPAAWLRQAAEEPLLAYGQEAIAKSMGFAAPPPQQHISEQNALPDPYEGMLPPVDEDDGIRFYWNASDQTYVAETTTPNWEKSFTTLASQFQNQSNKSLQQRAARYEQAVAVWSRYFGIEPDLVFALMYTESSFNPKLVSGRSAHGLMQVVPETAGEEVKRWLGESGIPTASELLDPYTNIKYGTGYFRLLTQRYFGSIKDSASREYCAIAAYNSGSAPIYKVFGENRQQALDTINSLKADEVLNLLLDRLPMHETRAYLRKVLGVRQQFTALGRTGTSHATASTGNLIIN